MGDGELQAVFPSVNRSGEAYISQIGVNLGSHSRGSRLNPLYAQTTGSASAPRLSQLAASASYMPR